MKTNEVSDVEALCAYCAALPPGEIDDDSELVQHLQTAWKSINSGHAGGLTADKLNRATSFAWESPILAFSIERHGAFAQGSKRATVQTWSVNLERRDASFVEQRGRQMTPAAKRVDVRPIAEKLRQLIVERKVCNWLKSMSNGEVRVLVGEIAAVASKIKPTREGRRKRLRLELNKLLTGSGWNEVNAWRYSPPAS